MREALHIFRKDSRGLRVPIALVLAWTALFVAAGTFETPPFGIPRGARDGATFIVLRLTMFVLPVGWVYLIAQLVHAEALRGDRQFWLTRPYRRSSLALAKAMFIVAYLTAPLALAQMLVLLLRGLPTIPYLPGLFWSHLLILALVAVPVAAIAAATSNLAQVVTVSLVLPTAFVMRFSVNDVGPFEWVRTTAAAILLVIACAAVLWIQFGTRKPLRSLLVALVCSLVLLAGFQTPWWHTAFAVQAMTAPGVSGSLRATLSGPTAPAEPISGPGPVRSRRLSPEQIRLRFALAGLPSDTPIMCEGAELSVDGPDGRRWSTPIKQIPTTQPTLITGGCTVFFATPEGYLSEVKGRPVNLHAVLYATIYGEPHTTTIAADGEPVMVPEHGLCKAVTRRVYSTSNVGLPELSVECLSAFRIPRVLTQYDFGANPPSWIYGRPSYSPFPSELRLNPVDATAIYFRKVDSVTLATRHVAGYEKVVIDLTRVDLSAYEVGVQ